MGRRMDGAASVQRAAAVERAKRVVDLRAEGKTFEEIADELGVSIGLVHRDLERTLAHVADPNVAALRAKQGAELTMMKAVVLDVVQRRHLAINQAGVVRDDEGKPLMDDGPLLAAVDRLIRIGEREAKLYGTDARPEIQITGTLAYEIAGFSATAILGNPETPELETAESEPEA